jgi:hypothetical protein
MRRPRRVDWLVGFGRLSALSPHLSALPASTPDQTEAPRHIAAEYIDQAYADTLREQFSNDPAKFAAHLEERGMTQDEYRKTIEENIAYGYMRQRQRKLDNTDRAKPK